MTSPIVSQTAFRGREDDGDLAGATWLGTGNNQDWDRELDDPFRVRLLIAESNNKVLDNINWKVQYSKNGGTYTDVNATSTNVRSSYSSYVADNATTVQRIGSGSYATDECDGFDDVDGVGGHIDLCANCEAELEYCVVIRSAEAAADDYFDFRVIRSDDTTCNNYNEVPRVTVVSAGGVVNFSATLASVSTTPVTGVLAVSREMAATLASASTTPDTPTLAVVRELAAVLASATTTPDTVTLDKLVSFLATLAAATTTPDTPTLALGLEFPASLDSATTTPDVAVLGVTYEMAATLAAATATPDAAVLALSLEFLATLAATTTTPDAAVLGLAYELAATAASATTTPDIVSLAVSRALSGPRPPPPTQRP
jgi:hypothetical protein